MERILVTGSAGFIGSHLVGRLLKEGTAACIVGLDNLNDYYPVSLKESRLHAIDSLAAASPVAYRFVKGDICDDDLLEALFAQYHFDTVVHLAAQAGVRYSLTHPSVCLESNVRGFYAVLGACRRHSVGHLIFASSSSVYGESAPVPFREDAATDHPVSLYAASKMCDELFAYTYSKLYGIPATGLRFFSVYGPAGRPDMAYFKFSQQWLRGEEAQLYNEGRCRRDFTYIDDVVEGIVRVMAGGPSAGSTAPSLGEASVPFRLYNIGSGRPVVMLDFIRMLQEALQDAGLLPPDFDAMAHTRLMPMQPGDVTTTYADVSALRRDFGFAPQTSLQEGLRRFAEWMAGHPF
ncbi:MAG: NAD-dependent epimerase/dehydratase family protein [Bacteroidales bacterium]|nr:NAD-dependent epimerase/dehydratase family protein [Bacteroidales bacterium]